MRQPDASNPSVLERDALGWGDRQHDRWLERWIRTTEDLARLQYSHRMLDAVIDEIDGRQIRVGDQWLTDYASCNYLGLDLDQEIIEAVPEYLRRWGTHPSWSRLLGSPVLYEQIEARLTALLGCEDTPAAADDHPHPHVGDPGAGRRGHAVSGQPRAQDDLRRMCPGRRRAAPPSSASPTRTSTSWRPCCATRAGAGRA